MVGGQPQTAKGDKMKKLQQAGLNHIQGGHFWASQLKDKSGKSFDLGVKLASVNYRNPASKEQVTVSARQYGKYIQVSARCEVVNFTLPNMPLPSGLVTESVEEAVIFLADFIKENISHTGKWKLSTKSEYSDLIPNLSEFGFISDLNGRRWKLDNR